MKYEKGQFVTVPNLKYLDGMRAVEVAVYLWICSYADENGKCFPGRKTIASKIKVSVHTVDKAITKLCEVGILAKEHRFVGNEKTSNEYQIMIPDEGGSPKPDTTLGSNEAPPQPQTKHIELNPFNQTKLTKQTVLEEFEKFWVKFPKKVGKTKAMESFEKALKGDPKKKVEPASSETILTSLQKQLDNQYFPAEKRYIPNPTTWLNQGRWQDEVEEKETRPNVIEYK